MRRPLFEEADDDAWGAGRKPIPESDLDITPLIDVVFLLLIFFMVTSTMQGTPDIDTPVAHFGIGVPGGSATIITLLRNEGDGQPKIILGDGRGPEGNLDAVRAYVEQGVRAGKRHVILKAERDLTHGQVQSVARVVGGVSGVTFNIGVQDKR